jgi:hypothetical protein
MVNDCMMHTSCKHEGYEVGMTEAVSTCCVSGEEEDGNMSVGGIPE